MGILERLWNYCPRPVKRGSRFVDKVTLALHLPRLRNLRRPRVPMALPSLIASLALFYGAFSSAASLFTGTRYGIGVLTGNPIMLLVSVPFFIGLWAIFDGLVTTAWKRRKKLLFLFLALVIITPTAFSASLTAGVFDSVTLTRDSTIDLYYCTAVLKLKNNGLTDVHITRIEIENISFDLFSQYALPWSYRLGRGQNADLIIYYPFRSFQWGGSLLGFESSIPCPSNANVTPTTFAEGRYRVTIYTDGLTPQKAEIEARYSRTEEVHGITARVFNFNPQNIGGQDYCLPSISISADMGNQSFAFVYSVEVGNLTLTFDPPVFIDGFSPQTNMFDVYLGQFSEVGGRTNKVIQNQPLTTPIFKVGETYSLTVRTMSNRNYTTSITMTG